MAMEYLYWCILTNMGLLDDDQICQGISNEWELCTPYLFEQTDSLMYSLVIDNQYLLPQLSPDGNYCNVVSGLGYINTNLVTDHFSVSQNYPNPFNPLTSIQVFIPNYIYISIDIYNVKGIIVKSLVNNELVKDYHKVWWNGTDGKGNSVPSGTYFYSMKTHGFQQTKKKMLLLK